MAAQTFFSTADGTKVLKLDVDSITNNDVLTIERTGVIADKEWVTDLFNTGSRKKGVVAASTGNLTLSAPGATIDGVTMASGDRVLVKNQTTGSENGIYEWNGAASAMTRAGDWDENADLTTGASVWVLEGTTNADSGWLLLTDNVTVGTTAVEFDKFADMDFDVGDIGTGFNIIQDNASIVGALTDLDDSLDDVHTATGIANGATSLGASSANGSVVGENVTVATAIDELDDALSDVITTSGVANGATDLGTFTGTIIPDSSTVKAALQSLETDADAIQTLTGAAAEATDLGTFTGSIIPDSSTVKAALQSLETDADALQTLTGAAAEATDLGTFTGTIIPDSSTVKAALQSLETDADAIQTLTGAAAEATDLGTFTGTIIPDSSTVKAALQSLETDADAVQTALGVAAEATSLGASSANGTVVGENVTVATAIDELDDALSDVITVTGVANGATDLGTFSGSVISDNTDIKTALQELETAAAANVAARTHKEPVAVVATTNGALATAYENGDTVDGVVLATNDRILLVGQTDAIENGIYTVNASGAPTRATDMDSATECASGVTVFVREGTVNAGTFWGMTNDGAVTPGTTAQTWENATAAHYVGQTGVLEISETAGTVTVELADDVTVKDLAASAAIDWDVEADGLFLDIDLDGAHTFNAPTNLPAAGTYRMAIIRVTKTNATDTITLNSYFEGSVELGDVSGATNPILLSVLLENDKGVVQGGIVDASVTVKGKVRLATTAETVTGTSEVLSVTPAGLTGWANDTTTPAKLNIADAGSIITATEVEGALQEIMGDLDDTQTAVGVADGATDLGTFTGSIIADNGTVKAGLQALETDLDAVQTLSGVAAESTDLGTFTGSTIADNVTVKAALQSLETAHEVITGNAGTANYTVTNKTVNRTLDCDSVTMQQLADVLGSVIDDLVAVGIYS